MLSFGKSIVSVLLVMGMSSTPPEARGEEAITSGTQSVSASVSERPPASAELREVGPRQRRWMSLPLSRLVVNPYDYWSRTTPLEQAAGSGLPLHAAYYCGGEASNIRDLLMLYGRRAGAASEIRTGWQDSLETDNRDSDANSGWTSSPNGRLETVNGKLRYTATGPLRDECATCAYIERTLEVDLDRYPWIQIEIPEAGGRWAMKVNDASTTVDVTLQPDSGTTGTTAINVAEATGWRGTKRFNVKFFAIGVEKPVTVSRLRMVGFDSPLRTTGGKVSAVWTPHELTAGTVDDSGMKVEARDAFYDSDTIIRTWTVRGGEKSGGAPAGLTLAGRFKGDLSWDASRKVLTVESTSSTYAIAFSTEAALGKPKFSPSQVELLSGSGAVESGDGGVWSLDFSLPDGGAAPLVCSVGFSTAAEGRAVAMERAVTPIRQKDWEVRAVAQRESWDRFLATVPRPARFDFRAADEAMDDKGVTAEEIRRAYYTAWVFLSANALPVMPESGFPYPQFPAGKPSLWFEGHPLASASASWESFFAMQLMGNVEPELAWQAYKGMMSLVDEDGRLGGESLPSRKAETGLVLYHLTSNTVTLREVYPDLRRHLLWARENPRWIHGPHNFPDEKDADFVVSLLMDMGHMGRIAAALEMPEEETFWAGQRETLFADYKRWFWESPDGTAYQTIMTGEGRRKPGNALWVASGLVLDQVEPGPYADGLVRRFHDDYDPTRPLAGMGIPKHPEIGYVVRGLTDRGMGQKASVVANAAVRDVTLSGMFAEQYFTKDFPEPDGVRPSVFGAAMLIDMLWLKNGTRVDGGIPRRIEFPGEPAGSVDNLSSRYGAEESW